MPQDTVQHFSYYLISYRQNDHNLSVHMYNIKSKYNVCQKIRQNE